ncbi:pleckstrin homology domain-containing family H member 1-like isoform X2 [Amphibalanus amphitrite]|uniref:pleckstrin homology domain-containing family H member 1-like isoform X2 n=1 Tax=Amphibalanus amphitrite TaxID=1232801 RepID=UPI001C9105E6|nr:pleckstrin homology domain-containing family H member 1-like isoform X2 [Amphibalanus amphitrite]
MAEADAAGKSSRRPHSTFSYPSSGARHSPPPPAPLRHSYAPDYPPEPAGAVRPDPFAVFDGLSIGSDTRMSVSTASSLPSVLSELADAEFPDTPFVWTSDEVNWQERCLELELSLQRFKDQAGRIRSMLRDKLVELEQRVVESEQKAAEAESKARLLEQRLSDVGWTPSENTERLNALRTTVDERDSAITQLQSQVEEQRMLRLNEAKQVEAKAARIKDWVTNKLRDLEEQNQYLREQNQRCNEQLQLLRNRLTQLNEFKAKQRASTEDSSRGSYEGDRPGSDESIPPELPARRVPPLDPHALYAEVDRSRKGRAAPPPAGPPPLTVERKRYAPSDAAGSGGGMRASRDSRVDSGSVDLETPHDLSPNTPPELAPAPPPRGRPPPPTAAEDEMHDYSEIYTPSADGYRWLREEGAGGDSKPPTPPLHRFPSWEAKIYQVAQKGIASPAALGTTTNGAGSRLSTVSNYSDVSVPVYATVKGRASQIRSVPFTGDSSDSSEGEEEPVGAARAGRHSHTGSSDDTVSSPSKSKSSPAKTVSPSRSPRREHSVEADTTADYALPPDADAASVDSAMTRGSYAAGSLKKAKALERSGYLTKLSGKLKTWRKRWFVLKDGSLMYWKSKHDVSRKAPQGEISLDERCRVTRQEGAHTFEVGTAKKTIYLTADNTSTVDEWVRVLQNVLRRNAAHLLLSREDCSSTIQGWLTKVKNGHSKRCWCVLVGKMLLYFKTPNDTVASGQINMRDCRVEEVSHITDSDEDSDTPPQTADLTVGVFPSHQSPTYFIMANKGDKDQWLYHLTVVSGGGGAAGTQFEQMVQRLMELDGDSECVLWRHPLLLHAKEPPQQPHTTMPEALHAEAAKLFKSVQLFASVLVDSAGIDYHVALAQNALQLCCERTELQDELLAVLARQTARHVHQRLGVQNLLLCATQSLFLCDSSGGKPSAAQTQAAMLAAADSKSNPAPHVFVQTWQLLALAVSLFVPKNNKLLWYLKLHLQRHADPKTETGKYAAYCQRALERSLEKGGRQARPSRMEVLSILLKNPYHHSLPHAIPVHFLNNTYQVVGFDGSTTIGEFVQTLNQEIGCRDVSQSGMALYSDDPFQPEQRHLLQTDAKLCDVISRWETALREKGSGKFENTRVIQLSYRSRLYWRQSVKGETDRERLLHVYQTSQMVSSGLFPLTTELALELAALMAQIDLGDYTAERARGSAASVNHHQVERCLERFFPHRYRERCSQDERRQLSGALVEKWSSLRGRSTHDCVRIYLTCTRKWPHFGSALFKAKLSGEGTSVFLAAGEGALCVLNVNTLQETARYQYTSVVTFGGCQDDFMLVVSENGSSDAATTQKLLFNMPKPKILELTLLIADYMNALGRMQAGGPPQMGTLTRVGSVHASRPERLRTRMPSVGSEAGAELLRNGGTKIRTSHEAV